MINVSMSHLDKQIVQLIIGRTPSKGNMNKAILLSGNLVYEAETKINETELLSQLHKAITSVFAELQRQET